MEVFVSNVFAVGGCYIGEVENVVEHSDCIDAGEFNTSLAVLGFVEIDGFGHDGGVMVALGRKAERFRDQCSANIRHVVPGVG